MGRVMVPLHGYTPRYPQPSFNSVVAQLSAAAPRRSFLRGQALCLTVALVVAAYVTWRLNWMDLHVQVGDVLLALLLFRLLLGFFGIETTRFSCFLASPRAALRYLTHAFHREPDRQAGAGKSEWIEAVVPPCS